MELITAPGHSCAPAALIASALAGCSLVVVPPDADQKVSTVFWGIFIDIGVLKHVICACLCRSPC